MLIAYCDCFSGVSGDMFLGALIDVGVERRELVDMVQSVLPGDEFRLRVRREKRGALCGSRVMVESFSERRRNYKDIREAIDRAELPDWVKSKAARVFLKLAEAEAKIHGIPVEDVHFHELGAVDTIVDVIGVVAGLYLLGVKRLYASLLPMGRGFIECEHGVIPNPSPATLEILRGIPVEGRDTNAELVTPTGAALIATLCSSYGSLPSMVVNRVGYGVGAREEHHPPNLFRLIVGEALRESAVEEDLLLVETTVDDMTPQIFSHLFDDLLSQGALDLWVSPVVMKKNRPGWVISILVQPGLRDVVMGLLFSETTTSGVRYYNVKRVSLPRSHSTVKTPWGEIRIKRFCLPDGSTRVYPEYEDCLKAARENEVPFEKVYRSVLAILENEP